MTPIGSGCVVHDAPVAKWNVLSPTSEIQIVSVHQKYYEVWFISVCVSPDTVETRRRYFNVSGTHVMMPGPRPSWYKHILTRYRHSLYKKDGHHHGNPYVGIFEYWDDRRRASCHLKHFYCAHRTLYLAARVTCINLHISLSQNNDIISCECSISAHCHL